MSPSAPPRVVRAPRGGQLSCRGWAQEAALRMLMNNLDPEVAERPEELVVYGGTGRAARSWEAFDALVAALRALEGDETLLVQSGKPVGVFRTHPDAPRVLIANSNLVPRWATWEHFWELERRGLIMYGQMTAGSWIYIGSQGIVQGTFETFAECADRHFGGTLAGRLVLTAGLGGMGGAQPLAVTMNGGVCLAVEVDAARAERRVAGGYCDRVVSSLDEAVAVCREAVAARKPLSVGLVGNAADVVPELLRRGVVPDAATDQTSAHDPLHGYVPAGFTPEQVARARRERPDDVVRRARASMAAHVRGLLGMRERGTVLFDYGNNLRGEAEKGGLPHEQAFSYPGFVPEFIRPLFCQGKGPFPGPRSRASRTTSASPTRRRSPSSRTTPGSTAGSRSRSATCVSRACRRASAGSATASDTASACASTGSCARAACRGRSSSAATISTPVRWPRPGARPRACGTGATPWRTGRS